MLIVQQELAIIFLSKTFLEAIFMFVNSSLKVIGNTNIENCFGVICDDVDKVVVVFRHFYGFLVI